MEIQQLIEKWTKEMADIKSHIKKHEDTFGHPAVTSRERLEAISEMLADIKQLKISCNPMLADSLPLHRDKSLDTPFDEYHHETGRPEDI